MDSLKNININSKYHFTEKKKALSFYLRSGGQVIASVVDRAIHELAQVILNVAYFILRKKMSLDETQLLSGSGRISPFHHEWALNGALLREIEKTATTPEEKQQIRFLQANYLGRVAPIFTHLIQYLHKDVATQYQVGGVANYFYHRTLLNHSLKEGESFKKSLVLSKTSPLIFTDTTEIDSLFPLKFTLVKDPTPLHIKEKFRAHFRENPIKALQEKLPLPFLFDLTELLGGVITKDKQKEFDPLFASFKKSFKETVNEITHLLIEEHPLLAAHRKKVIAYIEGSFSAVCRVNLPPIAGLKVLPLGAEAPVNEFMNATGLVMGAVEFRRHLSHAATLRPDIRYEAAYQTKASPLTRYYPTQDHFLHTALMQRLPSVFEKKPHLQVLGQGTLDLITGLLKEIKAPHWETLHQSPVYSQIIQTALFKIREHLATAELHIQDYGRFSQEIELVHAEISTLLEVTRPFKESDFQTTYQEILTPLIPDELSLKVGLGKTAVNVFAGINAAVMKQNPHAERCYSEGFYYEQASVIGEANTFEKVKQDKEAKIDLYVGQVNPNISVDLHLKKYEPRDIAKDIRYLLEQGKAAKELTVALDITIDTFHSQSVKTLLHTFQEEIKEGKLNFVFFRSGQKFDMLGMDNYYGAPFYTVNNGEAKWGNFDSLFNARAHRTDALSVQWFALSTKYAKKALEQYRQLIFQNTRSILAQIPDHLKHPNTTLRSVQVKDADEAMSASFIDLKCFGNAPDLQAYTCQLNFLQHMFNRKIKTGAQASFGFYHPNCITIGSYSGESSTVRFNPGINPEENQAIIDYFIALDQAIP